jgi:hypothetical protein
VVKRGVRGTITTYILQMMEGVGFPLNLLLIYGLWLTMAGVAYSGLVSSVPKSPRSRERENNGTFPGLLPGWEAGLT